MANTKKGKKKAEAAASAEEECETEEQFVTLATVKAMLAFQESAFKSIVDSLISSTVSRIDGLVDRVARIEASLEYSQKDIDETKEELKAKEEVIGDLKQDLDAVKSSITSVKSSVTKNLEKCTSLENHSRRNNIRVTGIPEERGATWEATEMAVKTVLQEKLNLSFTPRIERAHRTGSGRNPDGSPRAGPKPIVCRLYDWKEKELLLKKAREVKPEGIFVNEDVAEATLEKRREQLPRLKQAKEQGKIAYFVLNKLIIKDRPPG